MIKPANRSFFIFVFIWTLNVLCISSAYANSHDLRTYIKETKQQPAGQIESAPVLQSQPRFIYSAADHRSPFLLPTISAVTPLIGQCEAGADCSKKPIEGRALQMLESYALSELNMVGSLARADQSVPYALVKNPDGVVIKVAVGEYMGRHHGLVTEITSGYLVLRELVAVDDNLWMVRQQKMLLSSY